MQPCRPVTPTAPQDTAAQSPASRFIVVTGGPGGGKTTLINALGQLGFSTAPEGGRAIICEQAAIGGPALPWANIPLFLRRS